MKQEDQVNVNTDALRRARKTRDLSQSAVADAIGVSRTFYVEIEGGKSPSLVTALKIGRFFGRPVSDLFFLPDVVSNDTKREGAATIEREAG